MTNKQNYFLSVVLLLSCSCVFAQTQEPENGIRPESIPSKWTFEGYGTIGYNTKLESSPYSYVREIGQNVYEPRYSGFQLDSGFGLQMTYSINPQADAVIQAVQRTKANPTLENSIEWAFLSYRPTDDLNIRIGRTGLDIFMLSEYRSLGYSQTTVRPNVDYYGYISMHSIDGFDMTYSKKFDDVRWNFKTQYGTTQSFIPVGNLYNFVLNDFIDFSVTRESGPWRVKASYAKTNVANEIPFASLTGPLNDLASMGIPDISDEAASLSKNLLYKDAPITYASVGASYDDGKWVALGELSSTRSEDERHMIPQGTAAYFNIGRRIGKFTPFIGFSTFQPRYAPTDPLTDWAAATGSADLGYLQAASVIAINGARVDSKTSTIGVRWDVHPKAALKLQLDNINIGRMGFGSWDPSTNATYQPERINVLSASFDWVF